MQCPRLRGSPLLPTAWHESVLLYYQPLRAVGQGRFTIGTVLYCADQDVPVAASTLLVLW